MPQRTAQNLELLRPEDFGQYLLRAPAEILYVLNGLRERQSLVTLYYDQGRRYMLTSVLAVDDQSVVIDASPDENRNLHVQEGDHGIAATTQDRIKVQFALDGLRGISYEGRPAFTAALPTSLLRLQRREYYRLTTPATPPLKCRIPTGARTVETNVIDISGGGLAFMVPPEDIPFDAGVEYPNCRIDLPEVGAVTATLQVRGLFEITLNTGVAAKRAGCQFVGLPGPMLTLIQRYVIRVERERKARQAEF